jgi:hypothetical protein
MDEVQGLDDVPDDERRALRAKLVGDGSTALVPPRQGADWHDAVAAIRLGAEAWLIVPMADRTASLATRTADWARVATLFSERLGDVCSPLSSASVGSTNASASPYGAATPAASSLIA